MNWPVAAVAAVLQCDIAVRLPLQFALLMQVMLLLLQQHKVRLALGSLLNREGPGCGCADQQRIWVKDSWQSWPSRGQHNSTAQQHMLHLAAGGGLPELTRFKQPLHLACWFLSAPLQASISV